MKEAGWLQIWHPKQLLLPSIKSTKNKLHRLDFCEFNCLLSIRSLIFVNLLQCLLLVWTQFDINDHQEADANALLAVERL